MTFTINIEPQLNINVNNAAATKQAQSLHPAVVFCCLDLKPELRT